MHARAEGRKTTRVRAHIQTHGQDKEEVMEARSWDLANSLFSRGPVPNKDNRAPTGAFRKKDGHFQGDCKARRSKRKLVLEGLTTTISSAWDLRPTVTPAPVGAFLHVDHIPV